MVNFVVRNEFILFWEIANRGWKAKYELLGTAQI